MQAWNVTPTEAIDIQKQLQKQLVLQTLDADIRYVAGADLSYNIGSEVVHSAIVILEYSSLELVGYSAVKDTMEFPYIPGLLSFREIPSLMKAWEAMPIRPDVMLFDGQGIAHPRRVGVATHFGILAGIPTIGCAKNVLTGKYEEPGIEKGDFAPLMDKGETLGYALRTRKKVKPMFISPGHLVSLEQSKEIALACVGKYRMPEPTRQAHLLVNEMRRGEVQPGTMWEGKMGH